VEHISFISSAVLLAKRIVRLAYYNLGAYSLTHISTNHGELPNVAGDISNGNALGEGEDE
jgi:hypothetical protein